MERWIASIHTGVDINCAETPLDFKVGHTAHDSCGGSAKAFDLPSPRVDFSYNRLNTTNHRGASRSTDASVDRERSAYEHRGSSR